MTNDLLCGQRAIDLRHRLRIEEIIMRTPSVRSTAPPHIIPPKPENSLAAAGTVSGDEAIAIFCGIAPVFDHYASQYDTAKYWPEVYDRAVEEFSVPDQVTASTIEDALKWKYGHLKKTNYPRTHKNLVAHVQQSWPEISTSLPTEVGEAFKHIKAIVGGQNRFITVAFLTHLLYPVAVPIIDQHNFRAVNHLVKEARPSHSFKKTPSCFADIEFIKLFMDKLIVASGEIDNAPTKSRRELDRFLMMYGKHLKQL